METKNKNKIKFMVAFFVTLLAFSISNIYAASFSINVVTSMETGKSTTLTINSSELTGRYDIKSSNSGVVSVSQSSVWCENNSQNVTLTSGKSGQATITVTPTNVADSEGNDFTGGAKSITITVTEPAPLVVEPPINNNNNTNTNNNNTQTYVPTIKNSNTYLSYLELSEEGMTPSFVKSKENYAITVGNNVNEIQVSAGTEASTSYYNVYDNTDLKEGDNKISVVVTAEDGSTRTYYIVVTKSADPEKANAYLENLIIENMELSPNFQSEVLEYDLGEIEFNVESLNVIAFTKNEKATVDISGNNKLEVGQNEIKVTVTAEDGTTKKEYILNVTKKEESIETNALTIVKERTGLQKFKDFMKNLWLSIKANALLVIMYIFIVVEFIQIVYLYKKLNQKEDLLEKYGITEDDNDDKSDKISRRGEFADLTKIDESDSKVDIFTNGEEDTLKDESVSEENKF